MGLQLLIYMRTLFFHVKSFLENSLQLKGNDYLQFQNDPPMFILIVFELLKSTLMTNCREYDMIFRRLGNTVQVQSKERTISNSEIIKISPNESLACNTFT